MIWPATSKILALSVVAGEAMKQGSVLRFADLNDGTGRLQAFKATATTDVSDFGCFLAYFITPDSQDVDFIGGPDTTTFTVNTVVGIGGGTLTIASGTECVALGGSKTALVRLDVNSVYNAATFASWTPNTILKVAATTVGAGDGFLCLDADKTTDVKSAKVVQNDGATVVVLLA